MKKLILLIVFLSGCATTTNFTQENIDKLYAGMPATSVRELFGNPTEVRVATCGATTSTGEWTCETWTYRYTSIWSGRTTRSTLTFSVDNKVLGINGKKLNNWDISK